MEGSRRRDSSSPPVLADLEVTQGCENELSLSNSNSNSAVTVNNQIEDSAKDCVTTWTNEKHNLYLHHLESSFVKQLHRSIGILAWCSEKDSKRHYLSRKLNSKIRNTTDQLKTIHHECSEKIDLKRSHHEFAEVSDQNFADEDSKQKCRKKQSKTIL